MKTGDTIAVTLEGHVVAHAVISEISEGKAYLTIPATEIIMGVATSLTDLEHTPEVDRAMVSGIETNGTNASEASIVADAAAGTGEPVEVVETPLDDEQRVPLKERQLDSSAID